MKTALSLLVLLILTGCASPGPRKIAPAPAAPREPDKRVIVDPAARGMLRVVGVQTETGADGMFRIQVNVQNLLPSAGTFLYQVDWLDKDGLSLGISADPLPWTLLRHESASLTLAAPARTATDFRLTFRVRGN